MILVIAFVVVGPEDLPKVAAWLGKTARHFRILLREFREQAGIDEIERGISDTKSGIDRDIRRLKSESDLSREVRMTDDLRGEISGAEKSLKEE